tara:strand:+ start:610 stop:1308 length:699 start_codon:yes stop_codon:yes gene_type:complete
MTNQLKSIAQTYMSMQEKVEYPHKMYDPKTGKEVEAKTPEDHDKYAKMGYTHDKPKMEAMDPVNKDAVKKKFDDRKDKDIDNDGDVDSSDKFLHKRRKAISKAMADSREFIYAAKMAKKNGEKTFTVGGKQYDVEEFDKVKVKESTVLKSYVEIMQEDKAKASHTASPKAAEVEPEENPDLPTQKDMAPNTKKALDMHRKGEKRDYPADKNPKGTEKMKQAAKPKTLKDIRR